MVDNRGRSAVEVLDRDGRGIDPEVVVDRGEEIAGTTHPLGDIFTAFVGGSNEFAVVDAATRPQVRKGPWPVVATWLHSSRWGTGISGPGAGGVFNLGGAAELTRHDDQHALVEAAFVDILDQSSDRLVIGSCSEPQGFEHIVIDGMIVPILHSATEWTTEAGRHDFDARFDESPGEEQLLAPRVAAVAVAGAVIFLGEVERFLGFGVGQQGHRLGFELIQCSQLAELVYGPVERVDVFPQRGPAIKTPHFTGIRQTDVRHREGRSVGVT